jgi:hypothetical protein
MVETTNPEVEPESTATRIIGELLDAGEVVDDGEFTLDPAAAAAKLAAFSYADRTRYLLPIVEGLVGLGARAIELETVGEDLRIRGRGLRLGHAPRYFTDLYAQALGSRGDEHERAFGRIAIGLNMVLGDEKTKRVRLRYSGASAGVVAEYRLGEAPQLGRTDVDVIGELNILIDHAWLHFEGRTKALTHLRAAVRFSDRDISLDGEPISRCPRDWFETLRGEGPGYRFTAGLEQSDEAPVQIELWTAGVCVGTLASRSKAFSAAIVPCPRPRRPDSRRGPWIREVARRRILLFSLDIYRSFKRAPNRPLDAANRARDSGLAGSDRDHYLL